MDFPSISLKETLIYLKAGPLMGILGTVDLHLVLDI